MLMSGGELDRVTGQTWGLIGERQQGLAFRTGEASARMLTQEKKDKSEDQTKTNRKGEWNDRHGC